MKIVPHPITGEPILMAPERAARPRAFGGDAEEVCPFCPGNEALTPPEVARVERGGRWIARAFPNKYPAAEHHEVIVEAPEHEATFGEVAHAADVVALFVDRYRALAALPDVAYVSLFKNDGTMAGASIPHLHSQLLAVPFVPPRVAREAAAFARAEECVMCAAVETHRKAGFVVRENDAFTWLVPSGSQMANEQWLVPKRHQHEMTAMTAEEQAALAELLRASAAATKRLASSMNWLFLNFPREASAHWYVDVFPRRTTVAGFELATGTFIEVIEPAETARILRKS